MELRYWRHFDFVLLFSAFALLALGLAFIYSATWGGEPGLVIAPSVNMVKFTMPA